MAEQDRDPPEGTEAVAESRRGRNLKAAIAAGLVLAALALGLLYLGEAPFFALAVILILIAQGEFYLAVRRGGYEPATALGLVAGAILLIGSFVRGETAAALVLLLVIVFSFVWYLAAEQRARVAVSVAITLLGVAYVPLLGSFAALILRRSDGRGIIIAVMGAAAIYDVIAYAGGSRFGKRRLAPRISPSKTVEGAAAASAGVMVLAVILGPVLGPWSWWQALTFGALIGVTAPIGDLVESLIKRDLGIKDMGAIIPGHGGAMDRLDAILFSAPAAYLTLRVFGL